MKKATILLLSSLTVLAFSCKPDNANQNNTPKEPEKSSDCSIKDITAYAESADREKDELEIDFSADGKTISLTAPETFSYEAPVDPTKVHVTVTPADKATSSIAATDVVDLTNDVTLTITAEDGTTAAYTLHFVQTPQTEVKPTITVSAEEVWVKEGAELHLEKTGGYANGLTVLGENVYYLDGWILDNCLIKAIKASDGSYVKAVEKYIGSGKTATETCVTSLFTDQNGHFATGKHNWNGSAGIRMDIYDGIDAQPSYLFHTDTHPVTDLTSQEGRYFTVVGDLKGDAIVTTTTADWGGFNANIPGVYVTYQIKDGKYVAGSREVVNVVDKWSLGKVQRASMEDPTCYIVYNEGDQEGTEDGTQFIHFKISAPGESDVEMNRACLMNRFLDMQVFEVNGVKFAAIMQQRWAANGQVETRIYNISDPEKVKYATPEDEDYAAFQVFSYAHNPEVAMPNSGRTGRLCVTVDGNVAYLYTYTVAAEGFGARIICNKLTFNEVYE